MTIGKTEMVARIKSHAKANYEKGGWDVIVECYSDDDILEMISDYNTWDEAFKFVKTLVSVWAERQDDARSYREGAA